MKKSGLFLFLMALLAMPGLGQARLQYSAPQMWDGDSRVRSDGLLRDAMLVAHNSARADVNVSPMVWDEGLARDAAQWASRLARRNIIQHAGPGDTRQAQGENLWAGTASAFDYAEMAAMWVGERRRYVDGLMPAISRTGHWADVGHYSQIVWARTTHVGCAMVSNDHNDFLVCRYSPPGNVHAQNALTGLNRCRTTCEVLDRRAMQVQWADASEPGRDAR